MALKIVIERNIPYIRGVFDRVADVSYLSPEDITPAVMHDADALITRTRVRCDEKLLAGSKCKLIASATIGLDHVDSQWCEANGITVCNSPGCNAPAVAQYVIASLMALQGSDLRDVCLGIVGVGHVGEIVRRWAEGLGMRTLLCDPPRAEAEGGELFTDMADIAAHADAITFHTPLTREGSHPTYHLADSAFLNSLQRSPILINSARGAVVDNEALVEALKEGKVSHAVIDCWEGEPQINSSLLERAAIATPHIAGYSLYGKIRATLMAVDAVARHFGIKPEPLEVPPPPDAPLRVTAADITASYDPTSDTMALKSDPSAFERLRNHYHLRREP